MQLNYNWDCDLECSAPAGRDTATRHLAAPNSWKAFQIPLLSKAEFTQTVSDSEAEFTVPFIQVDTTQQQIKFSIQVVH